MFTKIKKQMPIVAIIAIIAVMAIVAGVNVALPTVTDPACADSQTFYCNVLDGENSDDNDQNYNALFDGTVNTKYCIKLEKSPYVVVQTVRGAVVTGYKLYTGNDTNLYDERNPEDWTLYGCNDFNSTSKTGTWVAVHTVTDDTTLGATSKQGYSFTFSNTKAYQYYKFAFTARRGGSQGEDMGSWTDTNIQLSEIELSGTVDASQKVTVTAPTYNPSKKNFAIIDGKEGINGDSYYNLFDSEDNEYSSKKYTVDMNGVTPYVTIKSVSSYGVILKAYRIYEGGARKEGNTIYPVKNGPRAWTLKGSNDYNETNKTGSWSVIDSQTVNSSDYKYGTCFLLSDNKTPYRYYKFEFTDSAWQTATEYSLCVGRIKLTSETKYQPQIDTSQSAIKTNYKNTLSFGQEEWIDNNTSTIGTVASDGSLNLQASFKGYGLVISGITYRFAEVPQNPQAVSAAFDSVSMLMRPNTSSASTTTFTCKSKKVSADGKSYTCEFDVGNTYSLVAATTYTFSFSQGADQELKVAEVDFIYRFACEHSFSGDYIGRVNANCEKEGNRKYRLCTNGCGACEYYDDSGNLQTCEIEQFNDKIIIPKTTDHICGNWVAAKDATCLEVGNYKYRQCYMCNGYEYQKDGSTLTCTEGEYTSKIQIPCVAHQGTWVAASAPTCCYEGNYKYIECTKCGKVVYEKDGQTLLCNLVEKNTYVKLAPTGNHTWTTTEIIAEVPATCTTDGVVAHWCCSATNRNYDANKNYLLPVELKISALGHSFSGNWTASTAPTCAVTGNYPYRVCQHSGCGAYQFINYSNIDSVATADYGNYSSYVEVCTASEYDTKVKRGTIDHTWADQSTVAATCTDPKKINQKCSVCEDTRTVTEGTALGHDLVLKKTQIATCTEGAWEHYECSRCDHDSKVYTSEPLEHLLDASGVCVRCGRGGTGSSTTVGAFTVTGGTLNVDYSYANNILTVLTDAVLTISNTDPDTAAYDSIYIAKDVCASIILAGVNINVGVDRYYASPSTQSTSSTYFSPAERRSAIEVAPNSTGFVTITIKSGTYNFLMSGYGRAGIEKTGLYGSLLINGTGKLDVYGGPDAPGIGSGKAYLSDSTIGGLVNDITIRDCTIFAAGSCVNVEATGTEATYCPYKHAVEVSSSGMYFTYSSAAAIGIPYINNNNLIFEANLTFINVNLTTHRYQGSDIGTTIKESEVFSGVVRTMTNIKFIGGSFKSIIDGTRTGTNTHGIFGGKIVNGVIPTAKNEAGESVYLLIIPNPNGERIMIDGEYYPVKAHSDTDTNVYAYVTDDTHTVRVGTSVYTYTYNGPSQAGCSRCETHFNAATGDPQTGSAISAFTVYSNVAGESAVSGTDYTYASGVLTIISAKAMTIASDGVATTDRIVIDSASGADITLKNVYIDVSATAGATALTISDDCVEVSLKLASGSTNILISGSGSAGLYKQSVDVTEGAVTTSSLLTISGSGELIANGGANGAGIGGSYIEISGGTIFATGGTNGAGIGGGNQGDTRNITISGGNVYAVGGAYGAGIGGGNGGDSEQITIEGGIVSAVGGTSAAGIGGGNGGNYGIFIQIFDGIVHAVGGKPVEDDIDTIGEAIGLGYGATPAGASSPSICCYNDYKSSVHALMYTADGYADVDIIGANHLLVIPNALSEKVVLDGVEQTYANHAVFGDNNLYVYVDGEDHTVKLGSGATDTYHFVDDAFVLCAASTTVETNETHHWHSCVVDTCTKHWNEQAHSHSVELNTDTYLKAAATCTSKAVYYKSCACGHKGSEEETFEYGATPSGHNKVATYQDNGDGTHSQLCSVCEQYVDATTHDFSGVSAADKYCKVSPTCTEVGVYYYHCKQCGLADTRTFNGSQPRGHIRGACHDNGDGTHGYKCTECDEQNFDVVSHNFINCIEDPKYLRNEATCYLKKWYYKACSSCGASSGDSNLEVKPAFSVGDSLEHDIDSFYDETNHWYACKRTGCQYSYGQTAHSYQADCSPKCLRCEYERPASALVHHIVAVENAYSTSWKYDANNHWLQCSNLLGPGTYCSVRENEAAHTYDTGKYVEIDGVHYKRCDTCQYYDATKGEECSYQLTYNTSNHWMACTVCGTSDGSDEVAHVFDNLCDTTCNGGCGYTREPSHNGGSSPWHYDDDAHWRICIRCQNQMSYGTHSFSSSPGYTDTQHYDYCTTCYMRKNTSNHTYDDDNDRTCNGCNYVRTLDITSLTFSAYTGYTVNGSIYDFSVSVATNTDKIEWDNKYSEFYYIILDEDSDLDNDNEYELDNLDEGYAYFVPGMTYRVCIMIQGLKDPERNNKYIYTPLNLDFDSIELPGAGYPVDWYTSEYNNYVALYYELPALTGTSTIQQVPALEYTLSGYALGETVSDIALTPSASNAVAPEFEIWQRVDRNGWISPSQTSSLTFNGTSRYEMEVTFEAPENYSFYGFDINDLTIDGVDLDSYAIPLHGGYMTVMYRLTSLPEEHTCNFVWVKEDDLFTEEPIHYQECTVCFKIADAGKTPHRYTNDFDLTCEDCGYERDIYVSHLDFEIGGYIVGGDVADFYINATDGCDVAITHEPISGYRWFITTDPFSFVRPTDEYLTNLTHIVPIYGTCFVPGQEYYAIAYITEKSSTYDLSDLTAEDINVEGGSAYAFVMDLFNYDYMLVIKLPALEGTYAETTVPEIGELTYTGYTLGATVGDANIQTPSTPITGLSQDGVSGIVAYAGEYVLSVVTSMDATGILVDFDELFNAKDSYELILAMIAGDGYTFNGFTAEDISISGFGAPTEMYMMPGGKLILFRFAMPPLSAASDHVHNYDTTYTYDATSHWYACDGCSVKSGVAAHVFTDDDDRVCDTCGYIRMYTSAEITLTGYAYNSLGVGISVTVGSDIFMDMSSWGYGEAMYVSSSPSVAFSIMCYDGVLLAGDKFQAHKKYYLSYILMSATEALDAYIALEPDQITLTNYNIHPVSFYGMRDPSGSMYVVCFELPELHILSLTTEVPSTCTQHGTAEHYSCSGCSKKFLDAAGTVEATADDLELPLDPDNHNIGTWVEESPATCVAEGTKGHKDCSWCNKHFDTDGTEIADLTIAKNDNHDMNTEWSKSAEGHWHACKRSGCTHIKDFASHTPDKNAPTETEAQVCTECGYIIAPATGHVTHRLTFVPGSPATCLKDGTKAYYACSGCSDKFEDAQGTQKIANFETWVVVKGTHSFGEWCAEVPATCVGTGTEAHKTCSVCAKHFDGAGVEIADLTIAVNDNHDMSTEWSKSQDGHYHACKRNGCTHKADSASHTPDKNAPTEAEAVVCTECGYIITPATGHVTHSLTLVPGTPANCLYNGTKDYYECSGCSDKFEDAQGTQKITNFETWVVLNGSHSFGDLQSAVPATCVATGTKEHKTCSVCGKNFDATGSVLNSITTPIAPDAHAFGDWIAEVPATIDAEGTKAHRDCTLCGKHFDAEGSVIADLVIAKLPSYTVNVDGGNIEGATESNIAVGENGSVTVVAAPPAEGMKFSGWYDQNGNLVSQDPTYSFNVSDNITLIARYEQISGTDTPTTDTPATDDSTLSGGAIAGIVIGSVFGAVAIAIGVFAIIWFVVQKKSMAALTETIKSLFSRIKRR